MHYTIVSDLHLGAGGELEDFLVWGPEEQGPAASARPAAMEQLDLQFQYFLLQRLEDAYTAGERPHLLLLGDIFDLWQARRARERPASALLRTAEAHARVITALRLWTGAGGLLTLVLGNHDQPLLEPRAWALLRELIPQVNHAVSHRPVHRFTDEAAGLYAEHGHQFDPFNRFARLEKWDADCPGRRVVAHVVNNLEPLIPLLDKGASLLEILELLWDRGEGEGVVPWQEVTAHLAGLIGSASGPARALFRELHLFREKPAHRPDFRRLEAYTRSLQARTLRQALRNRRATTGPLPASLRFFATGHTHIAACEPLGLPGQAAQYLNPGTWRPVVKREEGGKLRVEQPLNYIALNADGGEWKAELREWGAEAGLR